MADNLTTQSATPATVPSASVIATDDVSGVHFQRVKLVDGTLDSNVGIAGDATNGLDVDVTRVQGTVAVSGPLTDTQLRATAVPVSGSVAVSNFPASQQVTGTFWQATQPVSGTVGVSGTVTVDGSGVTQPVSDGGGSLTVDGSVAVSNFPASQAVTGTFWQATQPVSLAAAVTVQDGGNVISVDDAGSSLTVDGNVGLVANTAVGLNPLTDSNGLDKKVYAAVGTTADTVNVKSSAGRIYGWVITNISALPIYVRFYETSGQPTYASAGCKLNIMVPGNTAGAGMVASEFSNGIYFPLGIGFTVTGSISDTTATAVAASSVLVNVIFK